MSLSTQTTLHPVRRGVCPSTPTNHLVTSNETSPSHLGLYKCWSDETGRENEPLVLPPDESPFFSRPVSSPLTSFDFLADPGQTSTFRTNYTGTLSVPVPTPMYPVEWGFESRIFLSQEQKTKPKLFFQTSWDRTSLVYEIRTLIDLSTWLRNRRAEGNGSKGSTW